MKITYLTTQFWNGRQDINYQATAQVGDRVLRVTIHRDSYDFQSNAVVQVMTEAGWKEVHRVHDINSIPSGAHSAYARGNEWQATFTKDGKTLLTTAATILSAAGLVA